MNRLEATRASDWHRIDIVAALHKRGVSVRELSVWVFPSGRLWQFSVLSSALATAWAGSLSVSLPANLENSSRIYFSNNIHRKGAGLFRPFLFKSIIPPLQYFQVVQKLTLI